MSRQYQTAVTRRCGRVWIVVAIALFFAPVGLAQTVYTSSVSMSVTGDEADGFIVDAQESDNGGCQPYPDSDYEVDVELDAGFGYYSSGYAGFAGVNTNPYDFGPGNYGASATFDGFSGTDGNGDCILEGSGTGSGLTVPMETPLISVTTPEQPITQGTLLSLPVLVKVPQPFGYPEPPTGTVSLYYGAQNVVTVKLGVDSTEQNGAAKFSVSTKGIPQGSYSVELVYEGDANYYPVTSSPFNITIGPPATATTTIFSAAPNPVILGTSITLSTQVSPEVNSIPITGAVTFSTGATKLGQAMLDPSGMASLTLTAQGVPPGSYTVTAQYGGDSHYLSSSASAVVTVVRQGATSTTIGAVPESPVQGQSVTLSVTVSGQAGETPTPTGTVNLSYDNSALATLTLSSGVASYTVSTQGLSPGSYPLTATYNGSSIYLTSSAGTDLAIIPGVVMAVAASPNPVTQGQTVVLTAKVTAQSGNGTKMPTGSVSFSYGGSVLGTATLNSGEATLPVGTGGLTNGTDAISVSYGGDTTFAASSATLNLIVQ